jgi:hypothetical protein
MVWYVAVVAVLNLAFGYALALMLRAVPGRAAVFGTDSSEYSESADC